jgi:REP element-mobilizing transposase RayT
MARKVLQPGTMRLTNWISDGLGGCRESVHFAAWRISSWQSELAEAERGTVAGVLRQRRDQRFELLAFVVMDDHVQVLLRCGDAPVDRVIESLKSFSAHALREAHARSGAVWQRETSIRRVVDEADLRGRLHCVAASPCTRWPSMERYPWMWQARREQLAWRPERTGLAGSLARAVLAATSRH